MIGLWKGWSNLHVFLNWSLNKLFDWMYLHGIDFQGPQSQWVEGRLLWVLFICYLSVINSIKLWQNIYMGSSVLCNPLGKIQQLIVLGGKVGMTRSTHGEENQTTFHLYSWFKSFRWWAIVNLMRMFNFEV